MKQCALSTFDNPYNPFEAFESWFSFDNDHGYNSCGLLMRIAKVTEDMTDIEENDEIERAIDTIIKNDFRNVYIKVTKELIIPSDDEI